MMYFLAIVMLFVSCNGISVNSEPVARPIARQKVGDFVHGRCEYAGAYTHDLTSFNMLENRRYHTLGESWGERCRNCSCSVFGAACNGPRCPLSYDFSQDEWCIRWSEDGCCCEELGCTVDGVHYPLGSQFPYGGGNSCLMCYCEIGTSKAHCLEQNCGTYSQICENGTVTYDDHCCPHYDCPAVPCSEIPDPNPHTERHELMDWYGSINAIPVGMTRHFQLDTFTSYVCECRHGPEATCYVQSFKK